MVQENLAMKLEQESNELTRSDCNPVYASVWVPEECPNIGQPGHTGHFCLTGGRWEQVFAGYDCYLDALAPGYNHGDGGAGGTAPGWTSPDDFGFLTGCCGSIGGDTGSNLGGGPRGNQISDPIEDARVLAQLGEITANYGVPQANGTVKDAPKTKQKLELARTLDRLINSHPVYNNMFNLYKQKNLKITWRVNSNLGARGKAQIIKNADGSQLNIISFNGTSSMQQNPTVAEEMIHILQINKKGELTGNYSVPGDQHVCSEYEAKAIIKMIAANGAGGKFAPDSFFDDKMKYKDSNLDRYNGIFFFEETFKRFLKPYKSNPLPKNRNQMNWNLFINLLSDFNQYGPADYNFPATYDANGWEWAIMFELFNY